MPALAGQPLDRADEVELLHLAHERDDVARRLAAEAVVEASSALTENDGRLLGVERAQALPPLAHLPQLGVAR